MTIKQLDDFMLKLFAKCFEAVCSILTVINFILFGSLGGFLGYYLAEHVIYENPIPYAIILGIAGIAVAFFVNVFTFGFVAQITEIRRNLEIQNSNK